VVDLQFDVTTDQRPIEMVSIIAGTPECLGGLAKCSITSEDLIAELTDSPPRVAPTWRSCGVTTYPISLWRNGGAQQRYRVPVGDTGTRRAADSMPVKVCAHQLGAGPR
jgi:hypothetical protein